MGGKGNWCSAVSKVFHLPNCYKAKNWDNFGGSNVVLAREKEAADLVRLSYTISLSSSELSALAVSSSISTSTTKTILPPPSPPPPVHSNPSRTDISAIKIQAAFRGYLARKEFRAMRGLRRLRRLIDGNAAKSQTTQAKHCMQTMARVQTLVSLRRIRMAEENEALHRQLLRKRHEWNEEIKNRDGWDHSSKTKEQIAANMLKRRDAAIRRERSLSYAFSNQWNSSSSQSFPVFTDFKHQEWGWSWIERWTAMNSLEQKNTSGRTTSIPNNRRECKHQPANPKPSLHSWSQSLNPTAMRSKRASPAAKTKMVPASWNISKLDAAKPLGKQVRTTARFHGRQKNKAETAEKAPPVPSVKKSHPVDAAGKKIMPSPARNESHKGIIARPMVSGSKVASLPERAGNKTLRTSIA